MNGAVHTIRYGLTNRAWQGLRVGIGETPIQGSLATIAPPRQTDQTPGGASTVRSGYVTYSREADLPSRTYTSEVRPPNGCYDVQAITRPRIIGYVVDGEERFPAVAREGNAASWVAAEIVITWRSRATANPAQGC